MSKYISRTRGTRVGLLVAGALTVGVPASAVASDPVLPPSTTAVAPAPDAVLAPDAVAGQPAAPADGLSIAKEYLKQWRVGSNQPGLVWPKSSFSGSSARNYTLKGTVLHKFLQWEDQVWPSINLGWTDDAEPATAQRVKRWFFARSGAMDGPIRYGETIAIGNGGNPSFLRYAPQALGVNLKFSHAPAFEWRILGGPIGSYVRTNDPVALYNAKIGQGLIHFDRNVGGDIGWPTSERWEDQVTSYIRDAVQKYGAQALAALLTRGG